MSPSNADALVAEQLRAEWQKSDNQHELFVLPEEEVPALWVSQQVRTGRLRNADAPAVTQALTDGRYPANEYEAARIKDKVESLLGYVATVKDGAVAAALMKDFQGLGKSRITTYQGRRYIVFEGSPRMRSIVRGTRYRLDNPKIVALGIGQAGIKHAAVTGARLTIVLFAAYRVGELLLGDPSTLGYFLGNLASDIVKAATQAVAAYGVGYLFMGAMTAGVIGPMVFALVAGAIVGYILERIDERYGLTDKLIAALESTQQEAEDNILDLISEVDRALYNFIIGRIDTGTRRFVPAYR